MKPLLAGWLTILALASPGVSQTTDPGPAIKASIGRALPELAASPGFTYVFDPERGEKRRERTILGQAYLERAQPLGRHIWNVSVVYQWIRLDTFEGENLRDLKDTRPPIYVSHALIAYPKYAVRSETHQVTTSVTYGLTDDLDVNLTIPIAQSTFEEDKTTRYVTPTDETSSFTSTSKRSTADGIGDVLFRAKYRALERDTGDLAAGLLLRAPIGNEETLQATGSLLVTPMLYASSRAVPIGAAFTLRAYLNGGIAFETGDVGASEPRWGLGLDVGLVDRVTVGIGVVGRHPLRRIAPAGAYSVVRCTGTRDQCLGDPGPSQLSEAPLFGISGQRPDLYDFSGGARIALWRDTILAFANVLIPLNRDGARADVIPLFGMEAIF